MRKVLLYVLVAGLLAAAILGIFLLAPCERTMGDAQRILYVHVSVAWVALACFLLMAGTGLAYLVRRHLAWDRWSQAAAELGWLCSGLTLVTGALWGHAAWNTWWTWDPRLATTFVLWAMYSGYLILRAAQEDPHRRARVGAILAVVGVMDIPLVVMATRWFRGMHPVSPEMESPMRVTLLLSVVAFSAFFAIVLARCREQLHLESVLAAQDENVEI